VLLEMAAMARKGQTPTVDPSLIEAIGKVLQRAEDDPAFAALMLTPPLENELAVVMIPADPDAIHIARVALIRTIAKAHGPRLKTLYETMATPGAFDPGAEPAGRRALRNACLRYLTAADNEAAATLADAHYREATNMTDSIAGLAALSRMESRKKTAAFAHFHDRFKHDPLVLDKWMALQAGSPLPGTAGAVKALMDNPAFSLKNPNRVRSLLGAFAGNHLRFHARDGSGYALVGDVIRQIDPINPQVAARLAGVFETFRRYDPDRQALVKAELEKIKALPNLSENLFEVTTKMLEG
jgi:aminopeptidase N